MKLNLLSVFILLCVLVQNPALAVSDPPLWISCPACVESEAAILAEDKAPPLFGNGSRETPVYVVNTGRKILFKFMVWTQREPGLYSRTVQPDPVEASVRDGLETLWQQLPDLEKLEVPASACGSAADYVSSYTCRGYVRNWLDGGATGLMSIVRGLVFSGVLSANQVAAAFGVDRGPVVFGLVFADGSRVKITVAMGTDGETLALTITTVETVPDSAFMGDGTPIPTQAGGFAEGYEVINPTTLTLEGLLRMAQRWGISVTRMCGGSATFSCDSSGRCTLTQRC